MEALQYTSYETSLHQTSAPAQYISYVKPRHYIEDVSEQISELNPKPETLNPKH